MNSLQIFPSFSGLLCEFIEGEVSFDVLNNKNTIFCFGCSREGINSTFETYGSFYGGMREEPVGFLDTLNNAEKEGRLVWGFGANNPLTQDEWKNSRREWIKAQIISRGGIIDPSEMCNHKGPFQDYCTCDSDMTWNIPALNRWVKHFVSNLNVSVSMR